MASCLGGVKGGAVERGKEDGEDDRVGEMEAFYSRKPQMIRSGSDRSTRYELQPGSYSICTILAIAR